MRRQSCPLGIQHDVCFERVERAVSVVDACTIRESVPAREGVACAYESIERQGGRDIRNLRSHRTCSTVRVKGHRVRRQSGPLGIQCDVCAEGVARAISVVRACAIRESVPAREGVACAREGIER